MDWIEANIPERKAEILLIFHDELRKRRPEATASERQSIPQPQQPAHASNDDWARNILKFGRRQQKYGEGTVEAEAENYLYKDNTLAGEEKNSLLLYWESNRSKYPTIFALAVDLLPIQGTSVPCERLFSSSRRTK
ncbi:hypothetical protein MPER_15511, partial [Moniliophthora perniciosa FA553]